MAAKLKSAAVMALVTFGLCASFLGTALAQSTGLASMKLDGKQPISIESDRLEVLEAGNLIVFYAKKGTGSAATGSAAIERLEMSGKVIIKSEKQTATGDAGTFNMKSNTFQLTGSRVVLSEGGNVAVGCKLTVQMNTGKANLESCKKGGRVQIMINPQSAQGN
jgi:lipopolysaccharide export system protein LptA